MQCASCGKSCKDDNMFCPGCGKKLPELIKEQITREISAAFQEVKTPQRSNNLSTPSSHLDTRGDTPQYETDDIVHETDDIRKIEYKRRLREVFADGIVTADEVVNLARKIRELGLDKIDANNLQRDVARELGLDIEQEGNLVSGDIVLEINTNKAYVVGEMNNLEFRITNTSDDFLEKCYIASYLINLNKREERSVGKIRTAQKEVIYLPFNHVYTGNEVVELSIHYFDAIGNPYFYKTKIEVRVLGKKEDSTADKGITISFNADKIMGNDFSSMAEIFEKEKKQSTERVSSYSAHEKQWRRLYIFLDEEETGSKRDELQISRKLKEGADKLTKGVKLREDAERLYLRDKKIAGEAFSNAYKVLKDARECFKKVREINPEEEYPLEKVKEITVVMEEIENRIDTLEKEPERPTTKLTAAYLTLVSKQRRIVLFSKERITVGRDSRNDMVLRLIPYQPKEQFLENWQKTTQISSIHAEIINNKGSFYMRDIGSDNAGSANGTFINGKKLKPLEHHLLTDGCRINVARVLDLECDFLGESRKLGRASEPVSSCETVLGENSDSCFGVNKKGDVDAIKFRRRNNYTEGEQYIVLIRAVTIGKSLGNGIVIDGETVSDIHAKIFYRDDQYWLEDLNSRYGTRVDGKQVKPGDEVSLAKQAKIVLGDVTLEFQGVE